MFDVFVAVLATWQIIEIWHHSLLFAGLRSRVELWGNKLGELLGCPFCLSPWVALLSVSVLLLPRWLEINGGHVNTLRLVWYAFAVARLANLSNDLLHEKCRTPKPFDDVLGNLGPFDIDPDEEDNSGE